MTYNIQLLTLKFPASTSERAGQKEAQGQSASHQKDSHSQGQGNQQLRKRNSNDGTGGQYGFRSNR